jgi:hypothetical protein
MEQVCKRLKLTLELVKRELEISKLQVIDNFDLVDRNHICAFFIFSDASVNIDSGIHSKNN